MNVDQLIDRLSQDVAPVSPSAHSRRIVIGIAGGAVVTAALVLTFLGVRPDFHRALTGFSFWMKWAYTISLGIGAVLAVSRLSRPALSPLNIFWLLAVPVLLLAGIGIGELVRTPSQDWLAMWLGHSWTVCSSLVLSLGIPVFLGLLWSFRRMAPTRLRAAGAAAGLAAGAWSATIYCLHCPEVSAIFVLTWYSLGIFLAAAIGAALGPRLLRW